MTHQDCEQIEAARSLVAAPLIVTFANCYPDFAERIRATMKPEWERVGELVIMDSVLKPYELHLRVSQVPSSYHLELLIPEGYECSIREKFATLRCAMQLFWAEWCIIHVELAREIFRDDAELPKLRVTETACYWKPDNEYWLGILGYFTDDQGHKFKVEGKK